ncbi:MAG: transposase [Acidobacteria bacterium]|nr:transposase [Acidobacteriota bacterium]
MRLCRRPMRMFQISRDNPAYYLTSVAHKRLPIFQRESIGQIVCDAFNEARLSGGILIFAYVIMLDHTHLLTDCSREIADVLRFMNGISAKRVVDHLKINGFDSSLAKLRIQERENRHKHSVYEHHPNAMRITGEDAFMQKVNYIHLNPVRAGLVEHPNDYLFSSARQWHGKTVENEPLITDHREIKWRAA